MSKENTENTNKTLIPKVTNSPQSQKYKISNDFTPIIKSKITYSGKLIYEKDNGDYEILIPSPIRESRLINLSNTLFNLCYSARNYVVLKIMNGCKIEYANNGNLTKDYDDKHLFVYHVGDKEIESILFNLVGEWIDIEIECCFSIDDLRKLGVEIIDDAK